MSINIRTQGFDAGAKALATEMIALTIADLGKCKTRAEERDIIKWFDARSQEPMGYGWCLSVSGANPNSVRKLITDTVMENKRKRRKPYKKKRKK